MEFVEAESNINDLICEYTWMSNVDGYSMEEGEEEEDSDLEWKNEK